jgi:hypothetical protein
MSSLRSLRFVVHLGRHGATWALVHRAERDGRVRDSRLRYGVLQYQTLSNVPSDVVELLERCLADLRAQVGPTAPVRSTTAPPGGPRGRHHDGADVPLMPVVHGADILLPPEGPDR